ncbi:hypothetical protein SAMN05443551_2049 [Marivita hallyeonensis]|uniref:Uncharacterized protein n=1 Tax=Marivita hallyeonensis TaxID=996342 RepID=A0A1M5S911_9RHOB|nr:hypothetical protein SAMN05443551_2049 [Marivita hallyeonensis]
MKTNVAETEMEMVRATADIAAERVCLRCSSRFWSEGFGERVCAHCKKSSVWRSAISEGDGHGQRRSGGRFS